MEVPPVEILLTADAPSPLNRLGAKGAGEGGAVGVGAALANVVCDAFDGRVDIRELPLTLNVCATRCWPRGHSFKAITRAFKVWTAIPPWRGTLVSVSDTQNSLLLKGSANDLHRQRQAIGREPDTERKGR